MNDSKVIDLKSRKPFAQARAEETKRKRKATRQRKREAADAIMEHREAMIESLEGVLRLVREGRLEGLVLLARETSQKIFLTEVVIDERIIPPNEMHSFVGVMESLKLELADCTMATAPCLTLAGETLDPAKQPPEYEDYDFE